MCVELLLAVVTAVRRVGAVRGVLDFRRQDHLVPEGEGAGSADGEVAMVIGVAGTVGGDAEGALPEEARGGDGEKRAIDAAAIGHEHRTEGGQPPLEGRGLLKEEITAILCGGPGHSSQPSFSVSSSSSSSSSSSISSSSSPSLSSSSSSSSSAISSSTGDKPMISRFEPQSGQLIKSPLSTSNSSTSISASHSGQVAIHAP